MISMKYKNLLRALSLLMLLTSFIPLNHAALAAPILPPVDMFQLPWEQGKAWVAIDGFDNGSKRLPGSPHNYLNGGAIDFAPHNNMLKGENTSNFWVAAAADGTIVEISKCHMKIAHASGWVTEYQHLANIQVKLGDVVARNQRLAVIANASTQPVCPGSEPPDIPHLHFTLRPTMVGATFAGWEFRYNWFWNNTTFRKNGQTLGLYKPLLNVFDSQPTATPTVIPTSTLVNPPTATSTAPSGPYVSTTVNVPNINVGDMALVTVSLNNVPVEGYTSAEFTCSYDANLVEVSNVVVANLFGADAVSALSSPQSGKFILAIAGSKGNKATTSGPAFTFNTIGLQAGQTALECTARVSKGDNVLTDLPSVGTSLSVLGAFPTPTFTQPAPPPMTPTISPTTCNQAEIAGDIVIPPGTVMSPGTAFTKSWGLRNIGWCTWTPAYQLVFFSGELMGAPLSINIPYDVAPGQLIILSVNFTAPITNGHYISLWKFRNTSGTLFGVGTSANDPLELDIIVSDPTATPTGPTATPIGTATSPTDNWLTFTNFLYGFQFKYPPQGQIVAGGDNNFTRINLPIVPGTNLSEKYLEMIVAENANPCQSPLATQSMLETSETVVINGISFLKQTGGDAGAGNIYQWVAYSTLRDSTCVSLDFILHSHNPGVYTTPPPIFDYAAESAVFGQIVETYAWLAFVPTATPTFIFTPAVSPTPTFTSTPIVTGTGTPMPATGLLVGKVLASKLVRIEAYNVDNNLVGAAWVNTDGTFDFSAASGTNSVIASASGFLSAQRSVTITDGSTTTLPTITLLAGDIDNNNVIDQFDAMTIGMSYNTSVPAAADLNNDSIINVLDLELLARNYRKTGPVVWE